MSFPPPFYRFRPHPWHGLEIGPEPPRIVHAYIELTPFDWVKYEIDKTTGYLRVDRPQPSSSLPPTLYGFIPRTLCGQRVAGLSEGSSRGDGDPLDICVLSERPITRAEVILNARVVGGIRILDGGEADDKIVAVLHNDAVWSTVNSITAIPDVLVSRLTHYFSTYKLVAGTPARITVEGVYDHDHAAKVVAAAMADYRDEYGQ